MVDRDTVPAARERHPPEQTSPSPDLTRLLNRWEDGDPSVNERLFRLVYAELHRQATRLMKRQDPGHTLQASALVNEAYLKLAGHPSARWNGRGHFFSVAARAMRSVLVDHARGKTRRKRRGPGLRVPLDDVSVLYQERALDLVELDEALALLAKQDATAARIVELRFFGGLTLPEIAHMIGESLRRIERNWEFARAWLRRTLR